MSEMSLSRGVLVAGGAGYIGSHTAKALHDAGVQPVVLDILCTGNRDAARFGPFYEGSIADGPLHAEIVAQHRLPGTIFFAGHPYRGASTENPRKYFRNNVSDTIRCLDTLVDAGVRHVVFSSSCSVYGIQQQLPIREDST